MYVASLGLPLRMNRMHITQFDHARLITRVSITRNEITCILTICHVKLAQSIAMAQKRFDLRLLSPALCKLWLLLVLDLNPLSISEGNNR